MKKLISLKQKSISSLITFLMISLAVFGCVPEAANDESGALVKPPKPDALGAVFISAFCPNYKGLQVDGGASWVDIKISDILKLEKAGNWKVYVGNNKYKNLIMESAGISDWSLEDGATIKIHSKDFSGTIDVDISDNNEGTWDYKSSSKHFTNSSNGIIWIEDGSGFVLDVVTYTTELNSSSHWLSNQGANPLGTLNDAVFNGLWSGSTIDEAFVITDSKKNYAKLKDDSTAGNSASQWEETSPPRILLSNSQMNPSSVYANENSEVLVTINVRKTDSAHFDNLQIDLSPIGGNVDQSLFDDGENGDEAAGDNTYSIKFNVAETVPAGEYNFDITTVGANTPLEVSSSLNLTVIPAVIILSDASINPGSVLQGETSNVLVTVDVQAFGGTTFNSIEIDLSPIGGSVNQVMYDDGTSGDVTPADGTYSFEIVVTDTVVLGDYSLAITTIGSSLGDEVTASVVLSVVDEIVSTNKGLFISAFVTDGKGAYADGGGAWFEIKISDIAKLAGVSNWKVYTGNYKYTNLLMDSSEISDWTLETNNTIRVHSKDYTGTTDVNMSENNEDIWDFKTSSNYFANYSYGTVWIEDSEGNILDIFSYTTENNSKNYWLSSSSSNPLGKLQSAVAAEQWDGDTLAEAFVFTDSGLSYAKLKDDSNDGNSASDWEEIF